MTIAEYASAAGVSRQAVYSRLKKSCQSGCAITDMIDKQSGRLTDIGLSILNGFYHADEIAGQSTCKSTVNLSEQVDRQIDTTVNLLTMELQQAKQQVEELQGQVATLQTALQDAQQKAANEATKTTAQMAANEILQARLDAANERAAHLEGELQRAETDKERYWAMVVPHLPAPKQQQGLMQRIINIIKRNEHD